MKKCAMILGTSAIVMGLAGCSSLSGMMPKSEDVAGLESKNAAMMEQVGGARQNFSMAYADVAEAYGMQKEAELLRKEADRVKSSDDAAYSDGAEVAMEAVNKQLSAEKIGNSPEKKALVKSAYINMLKGLGTETVQVALAAQLAIDAKDIAENAVGADKVAALDAAKVSLALAAMVPGDVTLAGKTIAGLRTQAKDLGVDLPKDDEADDAI